MATTQQAAPGLSGLTRNGVGATGGDQIIKGEDPRAELVNWVVFDKGSIIVPNSVEVGGTISAKGVVGLDCPQCLTDRTVRVRLNASHLGAPRYDEVGTLNGRGQTASFGFDIPAPESTQDVTVRLTGQHRTPTGNWITDNSVGPYEVQVLTEGEKIQEDVIGFVPWGIGGGAVGVGAASLADRSPVAGGVAGVGAGVGAKVLTEQLGQGLAGIDFSFPTVPVVATAGLLGAGALLLSNVRRSVPGLG